MTQKKWIKALVMGALFLELACTRAHAFTVTATNQTTPPASFQLKMNGTISVDNTGTAKGKLKAGITTYPWDWEAPKLIVTAKDGSWTSDYPIVSHSQQATLGDFIWDIAPESITNLTINPTTIDIVLYDAQNNEIYTATCNTDSYSSLISEKNESPWGNGILYLASNMTVKLDGDSTSCTVTLP